MVIGLNEYCSDLVLNRQISIIESYIYDEDLLNEAMDFAYDTMLESSVLLEATTNRDMLSEFRKGVSEAKGFIKEGKKYLKSGDKASAKKCFGNAISRLDDLEKYLMNIDDFSVGTGIIGSICGLLLSLGTFIIANTIFFISSKNKVDKNTKDAYKKIDYLNNQNNDMRRKSYTLNLIDHDQLEEYKAIVKTQIANTNKGNNIANDMANKNNAVIDSYEKKSLALCILQLIKTVREVIILSKKMKGTKKGNYNHLRDNLIIYVNDMKKVLKLLYKV